MSSEYQDWPKEDGDLRHSHQEQKDTCRILNPNIPRAVRVGAAHGGTAGRGEAEQNRTPTGRVALKPTVALALQGIVNNCPERPFASTNKGKSFVKRWRNKASG